MNVIFSTEKCLLPKLSKHFDETDVHKEYEARKLNIHKNFEHVTNGLEEANLRDNLENSAKVLAAILILYKELLTKGPWYSDILADYANKLNVQCDLLFELQLEDLLKKDNLFGNLNTQMVFDECMTSLHLKLTSSEFKKYPSLVEVYCSFIDNVQEYNNITISVKIIPISLYLIDDYNLDNKKKGLKCCANILKNLKSDAFEGGNYYEVIYACLKKALMERDTEITRLVLDCLQELLGVIPFKSDFKISTSDELFLTVLEQIQSESRLQCKAALFNFMPLLIKINGVNCVKRKTFITTVCCNLDECCNKGVDDILLLPVVLCLEEWVKYCWCVFRLSTGKSLLTTLFKILYTCKEDMVERISKITATLITLCSDEEKKKIVTSLQKTQKCNDQFQNRLNLVNKYIHVS